MPPATFSRPTTRRGLLQGRKANCWVAREVRDYKFRLIDPKWAGLERIVGGTTRFKDLDNRTLVFKGGFRPAARYVFFHYCCQLLRLSWRTPSVKATETLENELGKPFWGTPGPYIRENMLRALMEEVGHEAGDLLVGQKRSGGPDSLLLDVVADKVASEQDEEEREEYSEDIEETEDSGSDDC
ncbi:hypothetical protein BJY00DRAFT_306873 [Aspergillus carlsbadensis]|nr:hypothetical protein BJY00DRAFT_306873 [Aspergillus carlsbadensis]